MMSHGKNCELFSENILGRVVLFFAVAFFVVNSWADCVSIGGEWSSLEGSLGCYNQYPSTHTCYSGDINAISSSNPWYQNAGCSGGTKRCVQLSAEFVRCSYASGGNQICNYSGLRCTSQCDVDSVQCVNDGMSWNEDPSAECGKSCGGQCPDPGAQEQCIEQGGVWAPYPDCECEIDTTICSEDRAKCQSVGGSFSGSVLGSGDDACCSSVCDLCDNTPTQNVFKLKRQECCSQNKAPPDPNSQCSTPIQSGCGMTTSIWTDPSSNDWECQDPNNSSATMDRFTEMCSENYGSSDSQDGSSDSQSSSSGDCEGDDCGSSSSQGGSSDSQGGSSDSQGEDGEGCEECKYLDSILDTLHRIHGTETDIKLCLQIPGLCPGLQPEIPVFQFDTAFLKYLRPLMDSSLRLDSNQIKILMMLDSNMIKQLRNDSAQLENDTVTWGKFHMVGDITDTSLHSMNDTTRKWLSRIADSIGVTSDSLAAHLDSILQHIPDSILDSIVKYQAYANDNFDSVLFGKGKGFSLVDSLIDSAVKYFQISNHYDSVYRIMFRDFEDGLTDEFSDLPGRNASAIGSALGYGDTATSNLRGDLKGIKDAIEGLGDGLGGDIAGSLDSAIRSGNGADTSGVSYGWLEHGERLGDSIKNGSGFGGLDFAGDSVMRDSLVSLGYSCDNDSCCVGSECIYFDSDAMIEDSLTRYVNRMGDSINQHNKDYLEDSTTTLFQEVKDSLTAFNPLGIFDSTLLSTLGAKIPNSNTCPDHCSKFEVDIPFSFGTRHFTIDYGLCLGRAVFGNGNILSFLRFIIRLIIAITCISAVMWNASRIRR